MKHLYLLLIPLIIAGLVFSGCSGNIIPKNEVSAATRVDPRLVHANTDFAIRLYHELFKRRKE